MNVYDTANKLATEIKESEEYVNYKMAREALALKPELKKKIGEFEVARYDAQITQMQTGKEDETKTVMNVYYNNEIVTSHEIPFESKEQMSAQDSTLLLDKLVDLLANDKVKCENKTCSYTLKNYDKNNLLLLLSLPTFGLYKDYLDSDDNLTLSYIITETTISEVTFNFTNGQSFKLTFSNFR